jgi:fumarate hydratase class I
MKTVKARVLPRPRRPADAWQRDGHALRDPELEDEVWKLTQRLEIGAQFGGKYFCHDVRVIRLPRHGASLPIGIGVSCSADRQAKAKITRDGVFLEQLETNPAQYVPDIDEHKLSGHVVHVDLNRPMSEIRKTLSQYPIKTRLALSGPLIVARDLAHAKLRDALEKGEPLPDYMKDHPIYYAGPAKTPAGMPSGSFGPTTAGRMDSYVELFMQHGGSLVTLAKGNRSPPSPRRARSTAASTWARSAARPRSSRRTTSARSRCSSTPSSAWRRSGGSRCTTSPRSSSSTTRGTTSSVGCSSAASRRSTISRRAACAPAATPPCAAAPAGSTRASAS